MDISSKFTKLGYLVLSTAPSQIYAVTGACSHRRYDRLHSFLPDRVLRFLERLNETNLENVDSRTHVLDEPSSELYRNSAGTTMQCGSHGQEFKVFDKVIPDDIVDILEGRLKHESSSNVGSVSFFVPFKQDVIEKPRTVIEQIILHSLAPAILGDLLTAVEDGYLGAEWWTQSRRTDDPKEYHLDTAISWCRDNGWPKEVNMTIN